MTGEQQFLAFLLLITAFAAGYLFKLTYQLGVLEGRQQSQRAKAQQFVKDALATLKERE